MAFCVTVSYHTLFSTTTLLVHPPVRPQCAKNRTSPTVNKANAEMSGRSTLLRSPRRNPVASVLKLLARSVRTDSHPLVILRSSRPQRHAPFPRCLTVTLHLY